MEEYFKMKLDRCKNGHVYDVSRYSTCPYCKSEGLETEIQDDKINLVEQMEDEDRTTAYWSKDSTIDPVVGWLTCIEGHDKGKDYRIVSERNFIGRGENMDIQISGDTMISRKNHCSISYNPKQRKFMLTPGDSNGLIYLNGEAVYNTVELRAYSVMEMGESKFVFVNLCGDYFDWEKEKAREENVKRKHENLNDEKIVKNTNFQNKNNDLEVKIEEYE